MGKNICIAMALTLFAPFAHADAASIVGTWVGVWTKAGDRLWVMVTFAKSGDHIEGSFDSDAMQVLGVPFASVEVTGDHVRMVLKGDETQTKFAGQVSGDSFAGTLDEAGTQGTFSLIRGTPLPKLVVREATFSDGDVKLSGETILPQGTGRHPAILFLHGSGAEGRWASRFLAQKFARAGFVALIYDKRGVGKSTGNWQQSGFEELVGDAVAGIKMLAQLPEVDPSHIGIFGHSQGATIAPWIAERAPSLGFVIASAGTAYSGAQTERYSLANSVGIPNLSGKERQDAVRFVNEIVAVAYEGKDRHDLDAMAQEFKGRAWYFDPPPPSDPYWSFSKRIAGYVPLDHWRNVHAPTLLLYGTNDERVPSQSGGTISALLGSVGNGKVALKVYPNADHTFRLVPHYPPNGWPKSVPDYVPTMVDWAKRQTR